MTKWIITIVPCIMLVNPLCCQEFNAFHWLEGTWELPKPNGSYRLEVWESKGPGALHGKGLKVLKGDTTWLESIMLYEDQKGVWYTPTVLDQNNNQPVPFGLVSSAGRKFIFENPDHDFPQRIVYEFKSIRKDDPLLPTQGDTLDVSVTLLNGEGIQYRFSRR